MSSATLAFPRNAAALFAAWACLSVVPAHGAESQHAIRPSSDSRLELIVEKTGLYSGKKHVFTFERYSGTLALDGDAPERSKVDLTIEASSIVCHDTWVRMKDLGKIMEEATKNMLAADRYPIIRFQSSNVAAAGPGKYEVQGMLTIRALARPVKVIVNWLPGGTLSFKFSGNAVVKLTDYGLKPPTAVLGAIGTKNEMQFHFRLAWKPEGASLEDSRRAIFLADATTASARANWMIPRHRSRFPWDTPARVHRRTVLADVPNGQSLPAPCLRVKV